MTIRQEVSTFLGKKREQTSKNKLQWDESLNVQKSVSYRNTHLSNFIPYTRICFRAYLYNVKCHFSHIAVRYLFINGGLIETAQDKNTIKDVSYTLRILYVLLA